MRRNVERLLQERSVSCLGEFN